MASGIQFKLRGFSIVNGVQDQLNQIDTDEITDTAANIFTQFLSTVQNFFGFLIHAFDNILPPDNPDEPINHWLNIAAHYLLAAVILIVCISLFICLFSCLVSIFSCIFMFILSIFRFLFMGIYYIVKSFFLGIFSVAKLLYSGLSSIVLLIYLCLMKYCLSRPPAEVKMMIAPGMAPLMIPRAVFEANPQAYFEALRMA